MSKRSIRKVRHYKPAPSFKERSQAGVRGQIKELWAKYGWKETDNQPEVLVEVHEHEHVHGPDCHHE
jgi:hypothetical protein